MTNEFDAALTRLLKAFNDHEDLRARKATLAELSRAAHEQHLAGMECLRATR